MKICTFLDRARDYKSWDWIQFVSSLIKYFYTHRKLVQTLPWVLSTYKNIRIFKKLPMFMSSSKRTGYNLLGSLLLPEHGNSPDFDYGLYPQYHFTKKIHTRAVGIFCDVCLYFTYPWYWRYMQLNCHIQHFLHICQQQPCLPQLGTAASWSHPALQDMNWPSEAGCLLQTFDGAKINSKQGLDICSELKILFWRKISAKMEEICY